MGNAKKDEIKASFTRELFERLNAKANERQVSFQSYVSALAYQATNDEDVIRSIGAYFRRSFAFKPNQIVLGRVIAPRYEDLLPDGKLTLRRSLKLPPHEYLRVCEVAAALACPPATATTILLFAAYTLGVDAGEDAKDSRTSSAV